MVSKNGVIWPFFSCHTFVTLAMGKGMSMLKSEYWLHNTPRPSFYIRGNVQKISSQSEFIKAQKLDIE